MKTLYIEDEVKYIGSQLAPHWIYKNYKIQGDAIVAFCGECEVKLTEMVDIEDVINNEPIYSKYMLSFISEQFNIGLVEGVFRQRLLITCIKEALEALYTCTRPQNFLAGEGAVPQERNAIAGNAGEGICLVRSGDDLFINNKKLSVSIATKSLTSILIHTGVNILSDGAPIEVSGLESDLGIKDIKNFALDVMKRYSEEIDDIIMASTKVRGV